MSVYKILFGLALLLMSVCYPQKGIGQDENELKHSLVSMRMIGHQILLNSGDSSSRVLPIRHEEDRYLIEFENDFAFNPDVLSYTIDSLIAETRVANSYVVEVQECNEEPIVYSYEVGVLPESDVIPCGLRSFPSGCYTIAITVLESTSPITSIMNSKNEDSLEKENLSYSTLTFIAVPLIFLIGFLLFFYKKRTPELMDPNLISIGEYTFDRRNMKLSYENDDIELTSKESDLLFLLRNSANQTLERELILKNVWGDEGDYVGRTLDVFISKLRKKLKEDPTIKIANIRGIGYRMVLNDME